MSRFSSFAEKARSWLVAITVTSGILYVMLEGGWLLLKSTSCSDEFYGVTRIAGHDFEMRVLDCRFTSDATIFISRPGGGKKTPLLRYTGIEYPPDTPFIREIDKHTVQIVLPSVGRVICLQDRWGQLRIKYDFVRIDDQVPECLR